MKNVNLPSLSPGDCHESRKTIAKHRIKSELFIFFCWIRKIKRKKEFFPMYIFIWKFNQSCLEFQRLYDRIMRFQLINTIQIVKIII